MNLIHRVRFPYPRYMLSVVGNTVVLWFLVQMLFVIYIVLQTGTVIPAPTWGIPAVLVWLDRRRNHEQLLHENLGASPVWFWAGSLLTSFALDVAALSLFAGG